LKLIKKIKMERKCPLCGAPVYMHVEVRYGQGDSTHTNYVKCKECGFRYKTNGNWGNKTFADEEIKAWEIYDEGLSIITNN